MKNNRKYSKQVVFQTKNNRNIHKHFQTGKITENIQTCFQIVGIMGPGLGPQPPQPARGEARGSGGARGGRNIYDRTRTTSLQNSTELCLNYTKT